MTEQADTPTQTAVPPAPIRGASNEIGKLAGALAKAQGSFDPPAKDKQVDVKAKGSDKILYSYKYADLASVLDAIKGALAENELALIQQILMAEGKQYLATTLAHSSGEWIRAEYFLGDQNMDAQAMGGRITYGRRYTISSLVGIASEEDDDLNGQRGAASNQSGQGNNGQGKQQQAPPQRRYPLPPNDTAVLWWSAGDKRWEVMQADDAKWDAESKQEMMDQVEHRMKSATERKDKEGMEAAMRDANILKALWEEPEPDEPPDDTETAPDAASEDAPEQADPEVDAPVEDSPESTPEDTPEDKPAWHVIADPVTLKSNHAANHIKPIGKDERTVLLGLTDTEIRSLIFPGTNTGMFALGQASELGKRGKAAGVWPLSIGWLLGPWLELMGEDKQTMKDSRILLRKAIAHYALDARYEAGGSDDKMPPAPATREATNFETRTLTAFMVACGADKSKLF